MPFVRKHLSSDSVGKFLFGFIYRAYIQTIIDATVHSRCTWDLLESVEQLPQKKMILVKRNSSNQEHGAMCQHIGVSHQATCAIRIGSPRVNRARARLFIKRIDDLPRMVALTRPRALHRQNHELGLFANLIFSVWPYTA